MPRVRPGLFHVTKRYLGEEVVLEPRRPLAPAIGEEDPTPRVSVCEGIDACLLGITAPKCAEKMYVYRAHGSLRGKIDYETPRKQVPDWEETNEAWVLEPHMFKLVGKIKVTANYGLRKGEFVNDIKWEWA